MFLTACPAPTASNRAIRLFFLILLPLLCSDLDQEDLDALPPPPTLLEDGEQLLGWILPWWRLDEEWYALKET